MCLNVGRYVRKERKEDEQAIVRVFVCVWGKSVGRRDYVGMQVGKIGIGKQMVCMYR